MENSPPVAVFGPFIFCLINLTKQGDLTKKNRFYNRYFHFYTETTTKIALLLELTIINTVRHFDLCSDKLNYRSGFTMVTVFLNIPFLLINLPNPA